MSKFAVSIDILNFIKNMASSVMLTRFTKKQNGKIHLGQQYGRKV